MTAHWKRWRGLGSTLAPASMSTVKPDRLGSAAAMAGRSTPGRTPMTYMPMAMAAPVLPAETRAWHSPSLQSSAATRREESRLRRSACDGGSAMPTTCVAWRTVIGRSCALRRTISRSTAALSPTSTEASPNSRAAVTAPSTTTAGPKSPPMASTAIFIGRGAPVRALLALDREDFPPLVEAALGADLVRQLDLPALRADRARGRGHLVVRPALAPARFRMASLWQRHLFGAPLPGSRARPSGLFGQPVGQALERRPPRVGGGRAGARGRVPVRAARRAETAAALAAERLHRQSQRGLGLEQGVEIDLVVFVDVRLEVVPAQLALLAPHGRAGHEARVHVGVHRRLVRLEAARADLGHARPHPPMDEQDIAVLVHGELSLLEAPGAVLERLRKGLGAFEPEPFLGNLGDPDDHGSTLANPRQYLWNSVKPSQCTGPLPGCQPERPPVPSSSIRLRSRPRPILVRLCTRSTSATTWTSFAGTRGTARSISSTSTRRSTPARPSRARASRPCGAPPATAWASRGSATRPSRWARAPSPTASTTTSPSSSRVCARPTGRWRRTARSTSTSTTARRTTARCCWTASSGGAPSSTRSSGRTTTAGARRAGGRPSTTTFSSTSRIRRATSSTRRPSSASPTWRRGSAGQRRRRAVSFPPTPGGTPSCRPTAASGRATRRRSPWVS